uniref:MAM domain-containing protein n=1 Tax=Magallana gigas TaxID=29159 RepID=A0A8W8LTB5_MAGGI
MTPNPGAKNAIMSPKYAENQDNGVEMFCTVLVFLTLFVRTILCSSSCVQFEFAQEVSPTESIQVLSNYSAASRTELFGICAPKCMKDLRCNAFDICNGECRTIRGWLPVYTDSVSGDMCERHQIGLTANYYYNTGPSSAKFGSYYKYIQSAYSSSYVYRGTLESIEHFDDKIYCLSLYYHMYGSNIKSLIISTQNGTDAPVNHWTMTGNQGNAWNRLSGLNLRLDPQTKVLITGEQATNYRGDIAIDFVELWPYACPGSA